MKVFCLWLVLAVFAWPAHAQTERVVDIPTRPGVSQRFLVIQPAEPKATVVLFAGGHGGLQIFPNGSMRWGEGNFLVRTRRMFAEQGFMVLVVDAPSDRQSPPFLGGFRQRPEHAADIQAVIAWARGAARVPVWLVGTSRGTQSVGYLATELAPPQGPDGVVLTSSILLDPKGRPVPDMPLYKVRVPVLVAHHEQDGCIACPFDRAQLVIDRLSNAPRKQLLAITGGKSVGDPCEAFAHHGFNGIEQATVQRIATWILDK
jgi:dienelactone hydrolase